MAKGRTEAPIPTRVNPFSRDLINWIPFTGIGKSIVNIPLKGINILTSAAGTIVGFRTVDGEWRFNAFKTRGERLTPVGNVIKGTKDNLVNVFSRTKDKIKAGGSKIGAGARAIGRGAGSLGRGIKGVGSSIGGLPGKLKGAASGLGGGADTARKGVLGRAGRRLAYIRDLPGRKLDELAHNYNTFVAPYLDGTGAWTDAIKKTAVGKYIVNTGDFMLNFDTKAQQFVDSNIKKPLIDNLLSPGEKALEKLASVPDNIINTFTATIDTAIGFLSTGVDRMLQPVMVPLKKL